MGGSVGNVPLLAKSRSGSTKLSSSTKPTSSLIPKMKMRSKKEQAVPVPGVVILTSQVQEHYPFPVATADRLHLHRRLRKWWGGEAGRVRRREWLDNNNNHLGIN